MIERILYEVVILIIPWNGKFQQVEDLVSTEYEEEEGRSGFEGIICTYSNY